MNKQAMVPELTKGEKQPPHRRQKEEKANRYELRKKGSKSVGAADCKANREKRRNMPPSPGKGGFPTGSSPRRLPYPSFQQKTRRESNSMQAGYLTHWREKEAINAKSLREEKGKLKS